MEFRDKTREQLIEEIAEIRRQLRESGNACKRMEAAVKRSEEKFSAAFMKSVIPMAITTMKEGRYVEVNEAFSNIMGLKREELVGNTSAGTGYITAEERAIFLSEIQTKGYVENLELPVRIKDGEVRYGLFNSRRIEIDKEEYYLTMVTDITGKRQIEDALRESEEKYRITIEKANEAINILQDEVFVFVNPRMSDLLGVPAGDLLGRHFFEFVWPEDRELVIGNYRKRAAGDGARNAYDFRFIGAGGSLSWIFLSVTPIQWEGKPATLNLMTDITDRKKSEEALRKSEALLKTYMENAPDGIYMSDTKGNFLYGNRRCEEIIGYRRDELIGKNFLELSILSEGSLGKAAELLQANIEGRSTGPDEMELINKEGRLIPVEINTSVFKHMDQGIIVLAFVRDITERRHAEEERQKLQERLQHADKMESIGTLAGGIAHDFNNLLMGIQGYASLVLLDLDPSHPHYERLKRIEEQVQAGAGLTGQLLGFARGGRYEVKPADMNDIIKRTSSMFARTRKEVVVHRKYGKDLLSVQVDRGQMEQVFLNLYVNAWQAMPEGGELYLMTENVLVDDEQASQYAIRPGRYVKVSVVDTGKGIGDKIRERIFDPFFTTKEMGKGTGLGLAMVYGIIKGHKGFINVDSKPGHGTTFTFYLPASGKQVVEETTTTGEMATGTETILLVDDENTVLEVSKAMMESLGYRVHAAGSGQEAIAVYMEKMNEIDLVVLDMIMPGISGGETFDRLKEINPNIEVVLCSGYSIDGQAREIMNRGCKGFIQKPFRLETLSGKVRQMLD